MYRDWEVGDKIVCINAKPCACCKQDLGLKEGEIYKIKRLDGSCADRLLRVDVGIGPFAAPHTNRVEVAAVRFRKLNKPDELHGSNADFLHLLNAHRSKQPNRLVPVKGVRR